MLENLHDKMLEAQIGRGSEGGELEHSLHFIRFLVGAQELLISVDSVEQVSGAGSISLFPSKQRFFKGLFVSRGDEVTAVVDLAELLGLTNQTAGSSQFCVVVSHCGERFGLLVDSVFGLETYNAATLENSHVDLFGSGVSVVSGVIKDSESVFPVIDVKAIFQAVFSEESRHEHATH